MVRKLITLKLWIMAVWYVVLLKLRSKLESQEFVFIPFRRLIELIRYKARELGIGDSRHELSLRVVEFNHLNFVVLRHLAKGYLQVVEAK